MYSFLRGYLKESNLSNIILEVNGIGYKIFVPISLFAKLPSLESCCLIHTSYVVREFAATLYGFLESDERNLFEVLQNVSGVGPKMALNLIGHLDLASLHHAIHHDSIDVLCKVPGIGRKTAERLIVELRDKLHYVPSELSVAISQPTSHQKDAVNALVNLGYQASIAQKAINKSLQELPENADLSTLITHALRNVNI